ncbi:hypothetical protein DRQ50_11720 [bacterium]|nr:MAG: hypothetical protein DRQ50_11720 [bacterium]
MKIKLLTLALLPFAFPAFAIDLSTGEFPSMEVTWDAPVETVSGEQLTPCSLKEYHVYWGASSVTEPAGTVPDGMTISPANLVVSPVVCDEAGEVVDDGTVAIFDITDIPQEEGVYYRAVQVQAISYLAGASVLSETIDVPYVVNGTGATPNPPTGMVATPNCPKVWMCTKP